MQVSRKQVGYVLPVLFWFVVWVVLLYAALIQSVTRVEGSEPPEALPRGYAESYAIAFVEKRPLVIFVGVPARKIAGCVEVHAPAFVGCSGRSVVVGTWSRAKGDFIRKDLPSDADNPAIYEAIGFRVEETSGEEYRRAPVAYQAPPMFYGQSGIPAYQGNYNGSCATGNCASVQGVPMRYGNYGYGSAPVYFGGGFGVSLGGSCGPGGCR